LCQLVRGTEGIELFYLPPYAPEHNPDEFLNNDVKQAMARRRVPRDKVALRSGLASYMRGLQRRPAALAGPIPKMVVRVHDRERRIERLFLHLREPLRADRDLARRREAGST
jgi:hypothetical protein